MAVPTVYVDETGIHAPDYPEILLAMEAEYREIFGDDVYIDPDSQDGQLLAVCARAIHDTNAGCLAVYASYSPQTAQGVGLSQQVKINGIRRLDWSYSSVDLRLVGQAGTVINDGMAEDDNGGRWILPARVVIPVAGEVTVTARGEDPGDMRASAHAVTRIATPTRGWQSVDNELPATPGRPVEKDAELRRRQAVSTALPSLTVFEGTIGAVASVPGVTRWRGYENDTNQTDANGIPAHTICMVVEGGDAESIAKMIALKKTPGTGTYGDTAIDVTDSKGIITAIRFQRSKNASLQMTVTIRALAGYLSTTGDAIKAAIAEYINGLRIGDTVWWSKLFVPANLCNVTLGTTYDIESISIGRQGESEGEGNILLAFDEAAAIALDDMALVIPGFNRG